MSWSTLLANQMVSYTDAAGGGFTLKPGQINPGTLQCMTKAQAFDMYYLQTTSNTNAVASNQLMRKDYWLSGTVLPYSYTLYYSEEDGDPNYIGFILSTEACSQTIYTRTVYSDSSTIAYGMPLYYDQYGTTPLSCNAYNSGAYIYYKLNSALITFQDNTGYHSGYIINSVGTCEVPSGYSYHAGEYLPWPSTAGYSLYSGGVTSPDDGYTDTAITLPVSFAMNGYTSTDLFVSTNGYITLVYGDGGIISNPQQSPSPDNRPITGNPGDAWLDPGGIINTDGDTQNIWYQTNDQGGSKYNVKMLIFSGEYSNETNPQSYIINFYKDANYQWVETRVKSNTLGGTMGPYNEAGDVSVTAGTISSVWRGTLNGISWTYMGTGSVY